MTSLFAPPSSQSGVFPVVFGHSSSPVWPIKESSVLMHWAVFLGIEVTNVLLLFLLGAPFRSKHPLRAHAAPYFAPLYLD